MVSYQRTRDNIVRAHAALERTSNIEADIADRRAREARGELPEPYVPSSPARHDAPTQTLVLNGNDFPTGIIAVSEEYPKPPIQTAADIEAARILSTEFAKELLAQIVAAARDDCREEIDALRSELMASRRRRRRKKSATAIEESGNDQS